MLVTLANAGDLSLVWANRTDAPGDLPDLIRRLILTTVPDVNRIHFRTAEGTRYPGWDGVVESVAGNAYVPAGTSVWEMGTESQPKSKANKDFDKRTNDRRGVDPADATFVFVTPRRWRNKDEWAEGKATAGPWRDVRVIDADDLEGWLTLSPVVHAWISSKIGKAPEQVEDLGSWWQGWSGGTAPPLSLNSSLPAASRMLSISLAQIQAPGLHTLRADSLEEALAFAAATIARLPDPERTAVSERALIVRDPAAWREIVACEQSLVLVPTFDFRGSGPARDKHSVIVPVGREVADDSSSSMRLLAPLNREAASQALQAMGITAERAAPLAAQARRNLLTIRRRLALNPELEQPVWARAPVSRPLVAAMLLGAWSEGHAGDRDSLAELAGVGYSEATAALADFLHVSDPPLRRVGNTWIINSREDAWTLLNRYLTTADVDRLRSVITRVFGSADPSLALPADERWMAGVRGQVRNDSGLSRRSLADTLALAATLYGDTPVAGGSTGAELASQLVREILRQANDDASGDQWRSLNDVLPTLAEAAPDVFLAEVDANLRAEDSSLRRVLADANHTSFNSRWYHTGLLWALERLAWFPAYLARSSLALARLAHVELDRRVGNRPMGSLRALFLPWFPQTDASVQQRLAVIDTLRRDEPDIAWQLMMSLLPQGPDFANHTNRPQWRRCVREDGPEVDMDEYWEFVRSLIGRILEDAGQIEGRLPQLVDNLARFPQDAGEEIIRRLGEVESHTLTEQSRTALGKSLRHVISQHRRFPDAKWAMPAQVVDQLATLYERFQPEDLVDRYAWLFSDYPELLDVPDDDVTRYSEAQLRAQVDAARQIYAAGALPDILRLAERCHPWVVARAVTTDKLLNEDEERTLLGMLGSEVPWRRQLAGSYVGQRATEEGGQEWTSHTLEASTPSWQPAQTAGFLLGMPATSATWRRAAEFGEEVRRLYWSQLAPYGLASSDDYSEAARELVACGRAWVAVDMLAMASHNTNITLDPLVVLDTFEQALQAPLASTHSTPRYDMT